MTKLWSVVTSQSLDDIIYHISFQVPYNENLLRLICEKIPQLHEQSKSIISGKNRCVREK